QLEELGIGGGDAFSIHRIGAAGENDALRIPRPNPVDAPGWRMDLAVDMRLPNPAGDQLGVLRAEVDDENAVMMRRRVPGRALGRRIGCDWCRTHGEVRSERKRSSTVSRGRETHQRPLSTITSAGRGRLL